MATGRDLRALPWKLRYELGARAASTARLLLIEATHLHCTVSIARPVRLGPGFSLYIPNGGTFVVGPGVDFRRGFRCEIQGDGRVDIGAGSIFSSNVMIQCSTSITIGRRCAFGQSTLVVDGQHRYRDPDVHWLEQGYDFHPLVIGDGAGISDKCTVQADVGERAVVASGSVVSKPIPPFALAGGTPARVVRSFRPKDRESEAAEADATVELRADGNGGARK
ncbi:MAG TPA: acyltransferase [Acidimicrobiales bacterium]|nr:acyltransferase [Acidimicrobiales bacterium]